MPQSFKCKTLRYKPFPRLLLKHPVLTLDIQNVRRRDSCLDVLAPQRAPLPKPDELAGMRIGERPDDHRVYKAKNGGIRADAQSKGDDRDRREAGIVALLLLLLPSRAF